MPTPLNVALLGYGFAGRTFHAPLIAHSEGLRLHRLASSQPEKVQADFAHVQIGDIDQALADPAVDLVVVATPNNTHAALAIRALQQGKHVVVDKPFALSVAEAQTMMRTAKQAGRHLSVFHNRRWDADFLTLRGLLDRDELGRVTEFHSHFDRFRPQVVDRWRERDEAGAGLWFDLGPHLLDQVLQLFGMPQAIFLDIARQRQPQQAPDYFHALLRYPSMRAVLHAGSLVHDNRLRFAVHGSGGSYLKHGLDVQESQLRAGLQPGGADWGVDPHAGEVIIQTVQGLQRQPLENTTGDYRQFYTQLAQAIVTGSAPAVTAVEALHVMQLLELGQQSAEEQREIPIV